jgi:hypothetical protein
LAINTLWGGFEVALGGFAGPSAFGILSFARPFWVLHSEAFAAPSPWLFIKAIQQKMRFFPCEFPSGGC